MTAKGRKPAVAQGRASPVAGDFSGLPHSGRTVSDICTSSGDQQSQILSFGHRHLQFPEHHRLKTEPSQRCCELRFPYAASRCNSTGLLEQMP